MNVWNAERELVQQSEILSVEFEEDPGRASGDEMRSIRWNATAEYCPGMFVKFFARRECRKGAVP